MGFLYSTSVLTLYTAVMSAVYVVWNLFAFPAAYETACKYWYLPAVAFPLVLSGAFLIMYFT